MSSVVVNFPGCAKLDSSDDGGRSGDAHTLTVNTSQCGPPTPTPWTENGWIIIPSGLLLLAAIVTVGIVRFNAHENKDGTRRAEAEARVKIAQAHKRCDTCGTEYTPTLESLGQEK